MTRARELAEELQARASSMRDVFGIVDGVLDEAAALLLKLEAVREAAETLCENSPPCGNWRHPELRAAVDAAKE